MTEEPLLTAPKDRQVYLAKIGRINHAAKPKSAVARFRRGPQATR